MFDGGGSKAYAEKSAAAVAEMAASAESLACQTAPLWPRNVPILGFVRCGFGGLSFFVLPVSCNAVTEHRVVICGELVNIATWMLYFIEPLHDEIK